MTTRVKRPAPVADEAGVTVSVAELERLRLDRDSWQRIAENLRSDLDATRARADNESRGHAIMFDLWCREVPPGWRCWRVRRRREAVEQQAVR